MTDEPTHHQALIKVTETTKRHRYYMGVTDGTMEEVQQFALDQVLSNLENDNWSKGETTYEADVESFSPYNQKEID